MTVELAAKVAFLRGHRALDGPVACVETHMSWVFLTRHRAFKLKKPIRLPYLDHSTLGHRRHSCEQEVRLGRRLAANVYIEVAPLLAGPRGLAIGRAPGAGSGGDRDAEVVDWLVVMRRLPDDRMLPHRLARGEAMVRDAVAVGDLLAGFYGSAQRAPWDGDAYRHRLRNLTVSVAGELVQRGAPPLQIGAIARAQLATLEHEARALDARVTAGRVVDAHGDLRPEHVCLEAPPVVIDPLEFDDDLRTLDAASELAFFAMECARLGSAWFGERVVTRYVARAEDPVPAVLSRLYLGQHALTRALIALRRLDDVEPAGQGPWRAKAEDYLARASVASRGLAHVIP